MGNSATDQGSLFIKTDLPFYMAGDQVTGTIYIDLHTQFKGNVVALRIKG